jgi:phosphohistidine phosphatase
MDIYILRHAKAAKDSKNGSDFDRPLNDKGKKQVAALSEFLKNHPISPERILVSPAKRTRQTYKGIQDLMPGAEFIPELYLAEKEILLQQLAKLEKVNSIMLIGHNDGLSEIVSYLTDSYVQLPTCAFVKLETTLEDLALISQGVAILKLAYYPEIV